METNGVNRDIVVNTFEGGLDLDSDSRLIPPNKLRGSVNTDITKRGDQFIVTGLKGETILSVFEDSLYSEINMLAATNVSFLVHPTSLTRGAFLLFYTKSNESISQFIVRAIYTDDNSTEVILVENISESDLLFLNDSTVDLDVVGKFGYDVVYFVDNRREPRKIECITYQTNSNVMTLTFNSEVEGVGYKQINLNLNSSALPTDPHRTYVYAYKTGGSINFNPVNPQTETVKYLDVNYSGSNTVSFKIYPEDYADYTFQIVYHKEGSLIYRNFIIGNPFQVQISVGSLNSFIIGLKSPSLFSFADNQLDSWEYLYNGVSFVGYIDTPTITLGVTKVYTSETVSEEFYVPDGFYQRADMLNTYFRVQSGVVTEQTTNNGNVSWSVLPESIEADVRASAELIDEESKNRLDFVNIHVPQTITVGGVDYTFVRTVANDDLGRSKISSSNNFTYQIEYKKDLTPVSTYAPDTVTLDVFIISVVKIPPGYQVIARAVVSSPVSQELEVNMRIGAIDVASGNILPPLLITATIESGFSDGQNTGFHNENFNGDVTYGPICVIDIVYSGPETIDIANVC
jgi:hypothetical protein